MTIRKKISDQMDNELSFAAFVNDPNERNQEWIAPQDFANF
jgi:hypothetical protein